MKKHSTKQEREERRQSIFAALEQLFFPQKKEKSGIIWFFLLIIAGLIGLIGYLVYDISQKTGHDISQIAQAFTISPQVIIPSPSPTPSPVPFHQQALQQSFETMKALQTMEATFHSDATVMTSSHIDNREQRFSIAVQGYVKGARSGAPIMSEMSVMEKGSGQTVQVGMAITRNGDHYIKSPNTPTQWDKRDMSRYPRIYENLPLDGSTFGFNFIETFFSEQNILFASLQRDTITEERVEKEGRQFIQYRGALDMLEYFKQLDKDDTMSAESKENAKKTLKQANVTITLLVDAQNYYVEEVSIDVQNLIQIDPERAAELGYDSRYNLSVAADFFSFNKPIEELVPEVL